jgi:hypothetical protein
LEGFNFLAVSLFCMFNHCNLERHTDNFDTIFLSAVVCPFSIWFDIFIVTNSFIGTESCVIVHQWITAFVS